MLDEQVVEVPLEHSPAGTQEHTRAWRDGRADFLTPLPGLDRWNNPFPRLTPWAKLCRPCRGREQPNGTTAQFPTAAGGGMC